MGYPFCGCCYPYTAYPAAFLGGFAGGFLGAELGRWLYRPYPYFY